MLTWALLASIAAVALSVYLYQAVLRAPTSSERANEIAKAISDGASAFLNRQYRTVAMVGVPIFAVIWLLLSGWHAFGFLIGAVASAGAGFIGMNVSVRTNVAHRRGRQESGFKPALRRGLSRVVPSPACWWWASACSRSPATTSCSAVHRRGREAAHRPRVRRLA